MKLEITPGEAELLAYFLERSVFVDVVISQTLGLKYIPGWI